MQAWQLQQAKSRFSELVDAVLTDGPQQVTRRGQAAVVLVSTQEYQRLSGQSGSLIETLLKAPRGPALNIKRSKTTARDIEL